MEKEDLTYLAGIAVLLICLVAGCGDSTLDTQGFPVFNPDNVKVVQGPAGKAGPAGVQGTPGLDGAQGSVGPSGSPGQNGLPGAQGSPGLDGTNGVDAPVSPFDIVAIVDPCGAQGGGLDEVLLRLRNGQLLAHYSDGFKQFFVVLQPGAYHTTDGYSCNFNVGAGPEYAISYPGA